MALVAAAFLVLAAFLMVSATQALSTGRRPDASPFGIAYLAITSAVMFGLAWYKRRLSRPLRNHPLATEARITFLDSALAAGVVCALVANAAFGVWWADALAAIGVGAVALREALDAWRDSRDASRMDL
jgi:divalent metal cation (Fe/Co/Zn/Cd) transporter